MRGFLLAAAITAAVSTLVGSAPAGAATAGGRAAPGTQLWAARFQASGDTQFSAMAVGPAGGTVFVTGASYDSRATGIDYETVAYSPAAGRQLWASRYSGPRRFGDDPSAVAVSPDGRTVFVTGEAEGWESGYDYATVAYSAATGRQLWASHYNGQGKGDDIAAAVAVSPDGATLFVTGTSQGRTGTGYATVAYRAATGRQLWASRYNDPGHGPDADARSLAVSPDGTAVYVTGIGTPPTNRYDVYATVAYHAADGTQLWVSRYTGPSKGFGGAAAVAVTPGGGTVLVTGTSKGRTTGYDYATIAYRAATGRQLWASRYHEYRNKFDAATAIAVSPDGAAVYVTGTSQGRTGTSYETLAYNAADGRQLWASRYHGYQANSVAVSPDGTTIYVTGNGSGGSGPDAGYATVAYRAADGRQLWASRYHVPGDAGGGAFSATLSPDGGTVYVTGNIVNRTTDDYATIAYHS
jgi:DNA-binding beta-propeller fold protein YncE